MSKGAKKPSEDSIEWDASYTAEMAAMHLKLVEDHLLAFTVKPEEQCASCIYWHCVALIGYCHYEAPKFFDERDYAVFDETARLSVDLRDKIQDESLGAGEALAYANKVRDLRYRIAGLEAYNFGKEPVLADSELREVVEAIANTQDEAVMVLNNIRKRKRIPFSVAVIGNRGVAVPSPIGKQLSDWIDRDAIADLIVDIMEDSDVAMTLDNAKAIWLDALENLHQLVRDAVKYKFSDPGKRKAEVGDIINLPKSSWKSISKAVDKLLDLEARQSRKTLTSIEFSDMEHLLDIIEGHIKGYVVGDAIVSEVAKLFNEADLGISKRDPMSIRVYPTTIEKTYVPMSKLHRDSIRVHPELAQEGTLVYLGCPLTAKWDGARCSTNQAVHKTIVWRTAETERELLKFKTDSVPVTHVKGLGVEPTTGKPGRASDREVGEVARAIAADIGYPDDDVRRVLDVVFTRKPSTFGEVTTSVSLPNVVEYADSLMEFDTSILRNPDDFFAGFRKAPPQYFVLRHGDRKYLVDTEGYDYPRYMVEIIPQRTGGAADRELQEVVEALRPDKIEETD